MTSIITSESPLCAGIYVPQTAYDDGRFSYACFTLAAGAHSIDVQWVGAYEIREGDGGWIRYVDGPCPVTAVPEFPTLALPASLIIGLLGTVLLLKRTKEN